MANCLVYLEETLSRGNIGFVFSSIYYLFFAIMARLMRTHHLHWHNYWINPITDRGFDR